VTIGLMAGLAFAAAALLVWIGRSGARTPQEFFRKRWRKVLGATAVLLGLALVLRGQLEAGLVIGGIGWLAVTGTMLPNLHPMALIQRVMSGAGGGALRRGERGVEIRSGRFKGRMLETLGEPEIVALARELAASDPSSLAVLEEHLDRRFPRWREDLKSDPHRWGLGGGAGGMTEQEAYEILGLSPGADREAVLAAHRALIKRLHPDAGGSAYLSARVNEARSVLLQRHR
jgi:hypothetical protein